MTRAMEDFLTTKSELRASGIRKYSHFVVQMEIFSNHPGILYIDEFTPDHSMGSFNEISRAFLHKFRHTYATLLIRYGTRIESLKNY